MQTKVLIAKESQTGQPLDLGIRCARVLQEASPQLNEGIVINHDDVLSGKRTEGRAYDPGWRQPGPFDPQPLTGPHQGSRLTLTKRSKGVLVIARQQFGFLRRGQPLSDSETAAGESFPDPENAPVNSPAPANGIGQKSSDHWTGVLKILRLTDKNGA